MFYYETSHDRYRTTVEAFIVLVKLVYFSLFLQILKHLDTSLDMWTFILGVKQQKIIIFGQYYSIFLSTLVVKLIYFVIVRF